MGHGESKGSKQNAFAQICPHIPSTAFQLWSFASSFADAQLRMMHGRTVEAMVKQIDTEGWFLRSSLSQMSFSDPSFRYRPPSFSWVGDDAGLLDVVTHRTMRP